MRCTVRCDVHCMHLQSKQTFEDKLAKVTEGREQHLAKLSELKRFNALTKTQKAVEMSQSQKVTHGIWLGACMHAWAGG